MTKVSIFDRTLKSALTFLFTVNQVLIAPQNLLKETRKKDGLNLFQPILL